MRRALMPQHTAARRWLCIAGLENLEYRVEVGDVLATSRRGAADKIKDPAVLETVIRETLHPSILIEVHGHDPLVDDLLRHEADRPFGALGNIIKRLATHRRDR